MSIMSRSWYSVLVLALALSTANALPVQSTDATTIEARSPRLIPDTQNYVHELLQGLGLAPSSTASATSTPTSTATATATPTASEKTEQQPEQNTDNGYEVNREPTPTTHITYESSTSYTPTYGSNGAGYTHTVKHQETSHRPVNVQIMPGWGKDRKLTAEDFPRLFDAVYHEIEHRVGNVIDSSDEIGLDGFMGNMEDYI